MANDIRERVIQMVEIRCRVGCGKCDHVPGYFGEGGKYESLKMTDLCAKAVNMSCHIMTWLGPQKLRVESLHHRERAIKTWPYALFSPNVRYFLDVRGQLL
jgi:hypothetical protein